MNRRFACNSLCLLTIYLGAARLRAEEPISQPPVDSSSNTFVDLLADKDLSEWKVEGARKTSTGKPNWVLQEDVLHCEGSGYGFLRYDKPVSDFILKLEYRLPAKGNSGVGIRGCPYVGTYETAPSRAGYEIQLLADHGGKPTNHSTASLYRYVAPKVSAAREPDQWNQLEIECRGPHIRVVLNDQVVQDLDQTTVPAIRNKPRQGYVSLQSHGNPVDFRAVKLQMLAPEAAGGRP